MILDDFKDNKFDLILMVLGLELEIVVKVVDVIRGEGKIVRVILFVCWELFEE